MSGKQYVASLGSGVKSGAGKITSAGNVASPANTPTNAPPANNITVVSNIVARMSAARDRYHETKRYDLDHALRELNDPSFTGPWDSSHDDAYDHVRLALGHSPDMTDDEWDACQQLRDQRALRDREFAAGLNRHERDQILYQAAGILEVENALHTPEDQEEYTRLLEYLRKAEPKAAEKAWMTDDNYYGVVSPDAWGEIDQMRAAHQYWQGVRMAIEGPKVDVTSEVTIPALTAVSAPATRTSARTRTAAAA